jgi:hypothetical protein
LEIFLRFNYTAPGLGARSLVPALFPDIFRIDPTSLKETDTPKGILAGSLADISLRGDAAA